MMGGMAIYMHSKEYETLWRNLARLGAKVFTDIDFVAYGKQRNELLEFVNPKGTRRTRGSSISSASRGTSSSADACRWSRYSTTSWR